MATEQSPRRLAEHQEALKDFNNAYVEYLRAGPNAANAAELRTRVVWFIPAAQAALSASDVSLAVGTPPLLPGNYVHEGLANTAFLHEQSGAYAPVPNRIQDLVRLAVVQLDRQAQELARQRRNPLYWGDRVVSAILRFPAYLIGKIVGVPASRIDGSWFGTLLRIVQFVGAVLAIYWGGSAAEWW